MYFIEKHFIQKSKSQIFFDYLCKNKIKYDGYRGNFSTWWL